MSELSLAAVKELPSVNTEVGVFSSITRFREVQEMAQFLAASDMVPSQFKGKPANCLIALEMSNRLKADPMMVMQNLYIVHGKPAWSSQFLIACVNSCGRFSALQYEFFGNPSDDTWGCYAYATEVTTKQVVNGPRVTIKMAKDEGWYGKNGSKWKTIPELMLTYRAATFFARTKAPEVSMGMYTQEEARDMGEAVVIDNEPNVVEPVMYPKEEFEANLPTWLDIIEAGKKTAEEIIATVETKGALTEEQRKQLKGES